MDKIEKSMSFDYGFFVSMAAIGIIIACASFLGFYGAGMVGGGYIASALVLCFTCGVLFYQVRKARLNISLFSPKQEVLKNDQAGVAMMMTSMAGDVVYSNKSAKTLFDTYELGEPKSPMKLSISNKTVLKNLMDELEVGNTAFVVSEIGETGQYLKLEVERIYRNGDFYSWRIFESGEAAGSSEGVSDGLDSLIKSGQLFDNSNVGFFVLDDREKVIHANKYFLNVIFGDKDRPDFPFKLAAVTDYSKNNLKDLVHFKAGGQSMECFVKKWKNDSSDDHVSYLLFDQPYITGRNESNIPVSENEFFLGSPIGIAIVDIKGNIREKNIIFGNFVSELELENTDNIKDFLQNDNAKAVIKALKKTILTGKPSEKIELDLMGESAKQGQFHITRASEMIEGGNEAIVYLHDITEQKNLELQFSQSQKMQAVGQLAGGVAHDFNNLLTAITGFCDLLLVKHGPGDQSFSDIIQIKQNANRAANLVRQLLAFSRQQTLRPKVIIMTDVVAELSNLLRRLIGSNIELNMNHGRNIAPVLVDQGQLEQVIINLCVNARDAMPDGGKLEIKTRNISEEDSLKVIKKYKVVPKGEYVMLEVIDTGTGIAEEHLNKVFEPFFSTKDVGKGTGLGLSTVYGIIKQTNGFVFPESELGVGTSFKIYLPRHVQTAEDAAEAAAEAAAEEKAKDLTGSSTILLVEDEDAVRMFASRALKNKGYTVYEADSGVSALQVIEQEDIHLDLLISDVMMPQMDGPTLVRKIRETDKELKVIFISGYAEDALDDNIMDKDFNFLSKPFSLKQLAEQVKEVLEK